METGDGEKEREEGVHRHREWKRGVKQKAVKQKAVATFVHICWWPHPPPSLLIYIICSLYIHFCQHTSRASRLAGTCRQKRKHVTENDTFTLTRRQSHACTWGQMSSLEQWDPVYSLCSLGHTATSIQGKPITLCVCGGGIWDIKWYMSAPETHNAF